MSLTEEQRDWLALTMVPGVGTAQFIRLLARFRTPENVLRASRGSVSEVVGKGLAERIAQYADVADTASQERLMAQSGAWLITLEDSAYPVRLAEIYDPPLALFGRGDLVEADQNCVSIVGTRRPSPYGIRMAEKFGRELAARGVTVVSGMASGVDAAAHRGAVEAGGRTIAFLGCGVDIVYPRENEALMTQIIEHGCVLSQFPMGTKPSRGHFPYRNRLISGVSLGTLIVEGPVTSGALITARHAAEQGREVFAVPGQIGARNSEGPHSLIRDGAKLVETVDDILTELELIVDTGSGGEPEPESSAEGTAAAAPETPAKPPTKPPVEPVAKPVAESPAPPPSAPRKVQPPSQQEKRVLAALASDGSHIDEIAAACNVPVSEALCTLTHLELKGLVHQLSGKRFVRV